MRFIAALTVIAILSTAASAAAAGRRGDVVGFTPVAHLSPGGVKHALSQSRIDDAQVRYGVDGYRLAYRTVDAHGKPTTASGLVVLPRTGKKRLRVVDYEHGTNVPKQLAPSTADDSDARLVALLDSSAGFAAVAPDYIGLGTGPGDQAYLDVASETSASVDMLRAARSFVAGRHRTLDDRIRVSGFSQGGQAAMGLARELQNEHPSGLRLGGLAAVAGPYDLEHAETPAILNGELDATISNYNLTEFALSWRETYGAFGSDDTIFQPGTGDIVALFDGRHDDGQLFGSLPHTLDALFRPALLDRLARPSGVLRAALRRNDATCRWRPRVKVALFTSATDEAVSPANTASCARQLRARGARVDVKSVGDAEHLASNAIAAPRVLAWLR